MSKQYGLILPGQHSTKVAEAPKPAAFTKASIFDESSESDDGRPQLKPKSGSLANQPGALDRRMARSVQEKALAEDPTVFQYDELYDDMESKREGESQKKSSEPKKPKYIGRLMEYAERRKLENELRFERQIQKERELEGEEFKDKEAFVTEAYRKKLEERRQLEEQEKRDEYLEAIGDVTKQKDLDGFYRHLYEQKLGTTKEVIKPDLTMPNTSAGDDEISYKPIKQQRAYRKRHSSDEEDEGSTTQAAPVAKKVHLQNNMDADSDFSIDSSSDDEGASEKKADAAKAQQASVVGMVKTEVETNDQAVEKNCVEAVKEDKKSSSPPPKPKIDKTQIWKKRTIGDVFEAAVKRYFERKAARGGG